MRGENAIQPRFDNDPQRVPHLAARPELHLPCVVSIHLADHNDCFHVPGRAPVASVSTKHREAFWYLRYNTKTLTSAIEQLWAARTPRSTTPLSGLPGRYVGGVDP